MAFPVENKQQLLLNLQRLFPACH